MTPPLDARGDTTPARAPQWLADLIRKPEPKRSETPHSSAWPAVSGDQAGGRDKFITDKLDYLACMPQGGDGECEGRAQCLNEVAFACARVPGVDRARLRQQLHDACDANGWRGEHGDRAVDKKIDRAFGDADIKGPYSDKPGWNDNGHTDWAPELDTSTVDAAEDDTAPLYADVAALLAGGLPEPPKPAVLRRTDDVAIFYVAKRNELYGDPGDGKTMLLLAAAVDALTAGGRFLFIDLDNNGIEETVQRLLMLGAPREALIDQNRFRYSAPDDATEVLRVVADSAGWATFAGIDCVGELLPIFGANSDKADDYTRVMRLVSAPLEKGGAGVVLLDHQAKNADSRKYGSGGTMAKRRAVSGVSINLVGKQTFTPGQGGTAELWVNKDRPGGLAQHCPKPSGGGRRRFAGTFTLRPPGPTGRAEWDVTTERAQADPAATLDPLLERHYAAAAAMDAKTFTVSELAAHANGLPGGTPPTDAQRKAADRFIYKLVVQGRIEPIPGSSPRRWEVAG